MCDAGKKVGTTYGPNGERTGEIWDYGYGKMVTYDTEGRRVQESQDWGDHTSIYDGQTGRKTGEIWP